MNARAEETLNLALTRDFGALDIGFNFKFEHDRIENSERVPSYALYDIRANYHVNDKLKLSAKIENLFDKEFVINDGFNTVGRQIQISVGYNF